MPAALPFADRFHVHNLAVLGCCAEWRVCWCLVPQSLAVHDQYWKATLGMTYEAAARHILWLKYPSLLSPKRLVRSIETFFFDLKRAWSLIRVYWGTPDYDWYTIALLMRHQIRRTRLQIERDFCDLLVDAPSQCRQMLIAESLLTRLVDNSYLAMARKSTVRRDKFRLADEISNQDMDMLLRQLKHLRGWWD